MSEHKRTAGNLSHITFNWNKKDNYSMPVATFGRDLKKLVPVGNPCLMARENIPKVPQDRFPCTYHPMFFRKIKKKFIL